MAKPKHQSRGKQSRRRKIRRPDQTSTATSAFPRLEQALALHQSGNLDQAKSMYCQILEREPNNADAWHFLGMVAYEAKQFSVALECLKKSNGLRPEQPAVLANLGLIQRGMGDLSAARLTLQRAVSLDPDSLSHRLNLGTVLLELKEFDSASEQFNWVLAADSTSVMAAMNLGNLCQAQGRMQEAESIYRNLLASQPEQPLVLSNLGETLRQQGKWEEAAAVLRRTITLGMSSVELGINLGRTLTNLNRHAEAREVFFHSLQTFPENARLYHYLGRSFYENGELQTARAHVEKAVELDPNDSYALCSLGFICLGADQSDLAEAFFRRALEMNPADHAAHSSLLFLMSSNPDIDLDRLFLEHQKWGQQHGNVSPLEPHDNQPSSNRRLRIGYVSPDLRRHAVAAFFRPVMEFHDSAKVETFCYAEASVVDDMTRDFQKQADHWRSTVGLSNEQVARQIRDDQIDILVDLAGHTAKNRLRVFAWRPAPVQVTWLGYPNTTGLTVIDYRLSCAVQNPENEPSYHTETIVRMPHGSSCFEPPANSPPLTSLPMIARGTVTFGALHRPQKISPQVRKMWAEVLLRIPASRLILFNTGYTIESAQSLESDLMRLGVDQDRVQIRNQIEGESYLTTYQEIDIALDVTPWAGSTTTLEALWMGVPVIAFAGQRRSARSTAAILNQVGLSDLIATCFTEYAELANQLSRDFDRLKRLRADLRGTLRRTVCNAERFTRDLEQTYAEIWRNWCEKQEHA